VLARFMYFYRFRLIAIILLSLTSAVGMMGALAYTNRLAGSSQATSPSLWLVCGLLLGLVLVVNFALQILLAKLGATLVAHLREELSVRFTQLEFERIANKKHLVFGSLVQDLGRIAPLVLIAPQVAYNALLAILCLIYLLSISLTLCIAILAALLLPILGTALFTKSINKRFDTLRASEDQVLGHLRAISDGKKEMSLNRERAEGFIERQLKPAIKTSHSHMVGVHLGWGMMSAFSSVVMLSAILFAIAIGRELTLPLTVIVKFVIAGLFLVGPLNFLMGVGQQISAGLASIRHLNKIGLDLDVEVHVHDQLTEREIPPKYDWREIRLHQLEYEYTSAEEPPTKIGPIDCTISRGETVFIVGGNGSGKSTLLLLLCSLLTPSSGEVSLDGNPIQSDLEGYRGLFSGVFGDFFLFPDVLAPGGERAKDEAVLAMIERFGLDGRVSVNEGVLSNLSLSTGQRKRLALIQCLAEDRDILFFDEWAADQDVHFRSYFYRTLIPEWKSNGKTIIAISHDDRFFSIADRIIEMEGGAIRLDGRSV